MIALACFYRTPRRRISLFPLVGATFDCPKTYGFRYTVWLRRWYLQVGSTLYIPSGRHCRVHFTVYRKYGTAFAEPYGVSNTKKQPLLNGQRMAKVANQNPRHNQVGDSALHKKSTRSWSQQRNLLFQITNPANGRNS